MIGQLCGKYRLIERIGRGPIGEVYRAEHDLTGDVAAVKVLAERISSDEDAVKYVFDQAREATRIGHQGIVRVLDYGRAADVGAYVATELLVGEGLRDRLADGSSMSLEKSLAFGADIAAALAAAHKANLVHGDIKPANIFIITDPDAKIGERAIILDFGFARFLGRGATEESDLDTAGFMAPERCRGHAVGPAADVYALGCLVFRMLTGRSAVDGSRAGGFTVAHVNQTPPPITEFVPDASAPLTTLIAQTFEKEPDDRPTAERISREFVLSDAGLYSENEATVLERGFVSPAIAEPVADDMGAAVDVDDGDEDEEEDDDIEVDVVAPVPKALSMPDTIDELDDVVDLPAPVAAEEEVAALPAPVPRERRKSAERPRQTNETKEPEGPATVPDLLDEPPTIRNLEEVPDVPEIKDLKDVKDSAPSVTFREVNKSDPAGALALVGGSGSKGAELAIAPKAPEYKRAKPVKKAEPEPKSAEKPERKARPPSDPALVSMIEDSAMGDDAPTMIVPAAIDASLLEADEERSRERSPPRFVPKRVGGGMSLPDEEEPQPAERIPRDWLIKGGIGAGIFAVLLIFLIARSCDSAGDPAGGPPLEKPDAAISTP